MLDQREREESMRFSNTLLLMVILLSGIVCSGCKQEVTPLSRQIAEVTTIVIQPTPILVTESFVAQVRSSHQVEIMARVSGFLEDIVYREGGLVTAGDTMFRLDPKPFQAQVDASLAEVEIRKAQLWIAQTNLDRTKPLADLDAASKSDLDHAIGSVSTAKAALTEAQARFKRAQLELGYATITSPVTGVSGQSLMREGAYITTTGPSSSLTYVAQLDPIWIEFSVSQNAMAKTKQEAEQGLVKLPDNNSYQVEVELSDMVRYPHKGKLSFADPSFNQNTGTFLVRAEVPNPDGTLRPGMFVKAHIQGAVRPNALLVPQKAVLQSPNGQIVFVVGKEGTAEVRPVMVGEWVGESWVINKGLQSGDQVIVDGYMRLAPGMPVKIVTSRQPPSGQAQASSAN